MFDAFISYSHRSDAKLAALLQRALERLGTPWWRRSALRVFRDDATLSASAALWPGIEAGLTRSKHFVLLASPTAAASLWVEREVQWWLANRSADRLLLAVTAGEIAYDERQHDFDWDQTTCLPPSLRGAFRTEPHWVDLRFAAALKPLTLRHTGLRSATLALAAAVRGIDKDELESADLRQHRRSIAAALGAIGVIAVLGLSTTAAVWVANREGASARESRLRAESRRLASEALTQLDGGRGVEAATLKAAVAWRLAPTEEARRALVQIDQTASDLARVLGEHTGGAYKLSFSRDGLLLATAGREGGVLLWKVADGQPAGVPMGIERGWPKQLRFSADGSHLLLLAQRDREPREPLLGVFRVADGVRLPLAPDWLEQLPLAERHTTSGCAALSPSGMRLAFADGATLITMATDGSPPSVHRLPSRLRVSALGFAAEDRVVFLAESVYGDGVQAGRLTWGGGSPKLGARRSSRLGRCDFASVSDDGRRIARWGDHLELWQVDESLNLHALPLPEPKPRLVELTGHHAAEFDRSGQRVAWGIGGSVTVWDLAQRRVVKTTPRFSDSHGPAAALSPDGLLLAALDGNTPVVWSLDEDNNERRLGAGRCSNLGSLEDCLGRLCERLTAQPEPARWAQLLGNEHAALLEAAKLGDCRAGKGVMRGSASPPR